MHRLLVVVYKNVILKSKKKIFVRGDDVQNKNKNYCKHKSHDVDDDIK